MRRLRDSAAIVAVLLQMTAAGWAAPRVALVIPISGDVQLAGAELDKPKLADEGQKVTLSNGAEVRIQLLGSSKEKVLKGKSDYTISKAGLEKEGKSLDRGAVSVVSEIGNLSRSAAGTSRPDIYHPVGLAFDWPPVLEKDRWISKAATPLDQQTRASEKDAIMVTITDLSDPSKTPLEARIANPVGSIAFAEKDLTVGHQYRLDVQNEGAERGYHREFRILTPEEQETLRDTERILRVTAINSDEMPTLIRLATLYKSFDQNEKMAEVLTEAINKPSYEMMDPTVQTELVTLLNQVRNSLDRENRSPK